MTERGSRQYAGHRFSSLPRGNNFASDFFEGNDISAFIIMMNFPYVGFYLYCNSVALVV